VATWLALVSWYLALAACGLLALPLALWLGRRLPDRGYGVARPLGLLLVGYPTWLLGLFGALDSTGPTVAVVAALVAAALWGWHGRAVLAFWRARRALVLWAEAVSLAAFLLAVVARAYSPAINGQEKFMDMALYHAFVRAEQLPAEDPWLAGYGMPYYYFGYFLWGLMAKVTAVAPAVGYNLALAATLAMLASGVFGLAYGLVAVQLRRDAAPLAPSAALAGSLGALATAVMGNLQAAVDALASLGIGAPAAWRAFGVKEVSAPGAPLFYQGSEWFRAARVIPNIQPDGITEFPWFSLLLGDLHPHFVALPFELLVLALSFAAFRNLLAELDHGWLDLVAGALALGALIPLNTWDVGTFWVLYAMAVVAALAVRVRRGSPPAGASVRLGLALLGAAFGLALVAYFPYFVGYQSQPLGLGVVTERTRLGSLLVLFGPLLVLAVGAVVRGWLDGLADPAVGPVLRRWAWGVVLGGVGLLLLAVLRDATLGLLLALVVGTLPLLLAAWHAPERAPLAPFGAVLLLGALGLLLGTELLFLRDTFGTRMNTVFKFYYHVWLLLGLLSPLLAAYLLQRRPAAATGMLAAVAHVLGVAVVALAGGLALAGLLYPVEATWAKTDRFRGPATLDGAAWLEQALPGDARAVRWLRERIAGRPVIVEAVGGDYTEYGRIAAFAGLPTPLNWPGHELQWRGPLAEFARRQEVVDSIYQRAAASTLLPLLHELRAEYVYVGRLEAEKYGPGVYTRFDGVLEPVYRQDDVVIYRVPRPPSGIGVGLAEVRP